MKMVVLLMSLLAAVGAQAAPPENTPAVTLTGAVVHAGKLDASLISGLPTYRHLVKLAWPNGQYRSSIEVEGYALKDILARADIQKKTDDGFDRPLDTFIIVKGSDGSQALLSYSEIFFAAGAGPILVPRARLLLPHKHALLNSAANDPTVFRSGIERDHMDLSSCASCHAGPKPPAISVPRGWLLVVPQDEFGGRFVEEVTEIAVRQTGIPVKPNRESAKTKTIEVPELIAVDGTRTMLTPKRYKQLPQHTWSSATFGMGAGFRGYHTFQGADLDAVLRPLLPAGTDPGKLWVLVTSEDGYRSLFSGSEVFAAPEGKSIMLANRKDGATLGAGSGLYQIVPRADFYIDRGVVQVKEIRIGLVP
jgi:hypothetical protein